MSNDDLSRFSSGPSLRKEDILFPRRSDVESHGDISLLDADWFYCRGFRLAAHNLASQVNESGTEKGFLIYPIIYLYRHYIELVLKAIITSAHGLLDRELSKHDLKTLGGHGLQDLWNAALLLLDPVCKCAGTTPFLASELDGVTSYIQQIHEHDPDGQRFRYAITKSKGGIQSCPSLSPDLDLKNVRALASAMERLADYLEGIEGLFVGLEDAKAEFERSKVYRSL